LPAEEVCLEDGEFFYHQIVGLSVVTTEGRALGKVEDILVTGSNDVYVVKGAGKEYLIPAISDVVKKIDLEGKTILIEAMEGLLD
jgi:16S rRNA processing protein RimM